MTVGSRSSFIPRAAMPSASTPSSLPPNFNQLFGRYRGSLTTAAGDRVVIDGLLGYMESHDAKW